MRRPFGDHLAPRRVDAGHLAEHHIDVLRARQNAADRRGDIGRRKAGGRHLVEQRLEQVIIVPVDHRDVEGAAGERFRGGQPAKPGTDDDDTLVHGGFPVATRPFIIWGDVRSPAPCRGGLPG